MIFAEIESCSFCSTKYILNKILVTGEIVEFSRGHNESEEKGKKKSPEAKIQIRLDCTCLIPNQEK